MEASEAHNWGHAEGFILDAPSRPCCVLLLLAVSWRVPTVELALNASKQCFNSQGSCLVLDGQGR